MQMRPATIAFAALLCGCATSTPKSESGISSDDLVRLAKQRLDEDRDLLYDCARNYAFAYETSNASASEIAEGALAACGGQLGQLHETCFNASRAIAPNLSRQEQDNFTAQCIAIGKDHAKGIVLDRVVRARTPTPP